MYKKESPPLYKRIIKKTEESTKKVVAFEEIDDDFGIDVDYSVEEMIEFSKKNEYPKKSFLFGKYKN